MTPMTVRGVPRGLKNDAWWMAADAQTGVGRGGGKMAARPVWLLILLIAAFDCLIIGAMLGLGFVAMILTLGAAAHLSLCGDTNSRRATQAWTLLLLAIVPAVDVVQFTSGALAWLGLTVFAAMLAFDNWGRAAVQLPFAGLFRTVDDVFNPQISTPRWTDLTDWVLPVFVGGVFAILFAVANPLLSSWTERVDLPNLPGFGRVVVWGVAGVVFWPLLRLSTLSLLKSKRHPRAGVSRVSIVNRRSVLRALIVFNAIFAAQTAMDISYLWGGVRLPDGMSYATYAHRGAYPLMATALLAGGFALMAQPWLDGRRMRGLLLVWVGQTMLLVLSSILRLDLYIDAYGLTHLRVAAMIWMVVVALGLVLLVLQILWRKSAGWMLRGAAVIGLVAVYGASLTNISGLVARQQLTQGPLDVSYVCSLNEGAAVEVQRLKPDLCEMRYSAPRLSTPQDWREWGFRNARLRRSLSALNNEAEQ